MPDPQETKLKLPMGIEVPVPHWTITIFGIFAVVTIAFSTYRYFFPEQNALITFQQANEQLQLEIDHYNRHIMDRPALELSAADGAVSLRMFADNCLLVSRRLGAVFATRLLIDATPARPRVRLFDLVDQPAEAAARACVGMHPGPFQAQNGNRLDQCWIEVWRTFQDGCQHVQLFNACNGSWATNPDGSPAVRWSRCQH